ncbi:ABC transporter ATP-binding protein [Metabacillus malikii]|uniref:ABC-2 type transport system ATP-binding protein n=1 Tax=Metabacillus malikii TaxID=1504265 RepID=A0ABT9ZBU3_9BACI|nr:ABC transporter ATP-binding protein [Metabacillus malikii]MDQ0229068.1 ABC-2 type transport system ATP-binding protein [Metabacillus malikii]
MKIIELTEVSKAYGESTVVNGIDLEVNAGEIFGFIGPNGAGKSTSISMMSAQLDPTRGTIKIDGELITNKNDTIKNKIGIVPQDIALYDTLSAYDNLDFFASLYGMKKKEKKEKINWILDMVGLQDRSKELIHTFSGGMKRRINIAAALLHDPKIIFMDEPTVGIDPQSRNSIYELIKVLKDMGKTVVYTTHYMEEVQSMCDRVAIIDKGVIIKRGTVSELVAEIYDGLLEIKLKEPCPEAILNELKEIDGVMNMQNNQATELSIVIKDPQQIISKIMSLLNENDQVIENIQLLPSNLETLFLYLTGKKLRD